jgi:hypothetical protein
VPLYNSIFDKLALAEKRISRTTVSMVTPSFFFLLWKPKTIILAFLLLIFISIPNQPEGKVKAFTSENPSASHSKPNLIISALSDAKYLDNVFVFMSSLEGSLGNELRVAQRERAASLPAEVEVKIITPPDFTKSMPEGFHLLLHRYQNLEFLGELPVNGTWAMFSRYIGLAKLVNEIKSRYDKILFSDLDVMFQRNPFSMPMETDVELLLFAEWQGRTIGQCDSHLGWFDQCIRSRANVTQEQYLSYKSLPRIVMANDLKESDYECNDQALHEHNFHSGRFQEALIVHSSNKVEVKLMKEEEDSLVSTVGSAPYARYNVWGELLNHRDEILTIVHQFKWHSRLAEIVRQKYGARATLFGPLVPPKAELIQNAEFSVANPNELPRYIVSGLPDTCNSENALCSCRWDDCQWQVYI